VNAVDIPPVPEAERTALAAIALHLRGDGRGVQVLLRGAGDLPAVAASAIIRHVRSATPPRVSGSPRFAGTGASRRRP
jgi:hypothetical protein